MLGKVDGEALELWIGIYGEEQLGSVKEQPWVTKLCEELGEVFDTYILTLQQY